MGQISPEAQYHEIYTDLRHHDSLIWQIVSVIITIDSGTVGATFVLDTSWIIKDLVTCFAILLTFVIIIALIKHRYFSRLENETLMILESRYAEKYVQKTTIPKIGTELRQDKDFWSKTLPHHWTQKMSGHLYLIRATIVMFWVLCELLFVHPVVSIYQYVSTTHSFFVFWVTLGVGIIGLGIASGALLTVQLIKIWKMLE